MIRILSYVLMFWLLATPADAAALVGLLAGTAGFTGTLTIAGLAVNSIGFRLLASVALTALSRALQKQPEQPGIRTQYPTSGGANPQTFIVGFFASEGNQTCPDYSFGDVGGTPNAYLVKVRDFGDQPGMSLSRVMINKEYVTLDATPHADFGYPVLEYREDGTDYAWVKYYDGTQTVADPFLLATFALDPDYPWSADMVGTGIPYCIFTYRYNRERFSGDPSQRCEFVDLPFYDPRKDSSVGGSGAHRWGDWATYEATQNPQVIKYNILRGIALPDGNVWGGEAAAEDLPLDNWFAAMNECDVVRDGETEAQYRCGFEIAVNQQPADIIDELDKACLGQTFESGGVWKTRTGGPGLPVYYFADDDVINTEEQELDPFPGLESTYNGIQATYPDPESLWNPKEAPARYKAAWEVEDQNRRLVASVQYNAVPYGKQVQRLMKAAINEERRFARHSLVLPPDSAILEPLDAIGWTSARNGYAAKVFEVSRSADDQISCNQAIAIREADSSDYYWEAGYSLPSTPTISGRVVPAAQTVPGWDVIASPINDAASAPRRAALALIWNPAGLDDVRAVKWQVRIKATAEIVSIGTTHDVEAGLVVITSGVLPAVEYEARGRLVVKRRTVWTAWVSDIADAVLLGGADIEAGSITPAHLDPDVTAVINAAVVATDASRILAEAAAGAADDSAFASDASRISAEAAQGAAAAIALEGFHANFRNDGAYFTSTSGGAPGDNDLDARWTFYDAVGVGRAAKIADMETVITDYLGSSVVIAPQDGRTYRLTVTARKVVTLTAGPEITLRFVKMDESYIYLASSYAQSNQTLTTSWAEYSTSFTYDAADGIAYIRPQLFRHSGVTGTGRVEIASFIVEDVTESAGASAASAAAYVSETNSAAALADAETQAAAAQSSKEVTARLLLQGMAGNPIFSTWNGTDTSYADGYFYLDQSEGTITLDTANAKYGASLLLTPIATPTVARPRIRLESVQNEARAPYDAVDVAGVAVVVEIELVTGAWQGRFYVGWIKSGTGGTSASVSLAPSDYLVAEIGLIQRLDVFVARPDSFVAGSGRTELVIWYEPTSTAGDGRAFNETRVHYFDARPLYKQASALITQTAIADLQGNAAASIVLAARAGSGGAVMEMVAADDPAGGPVSGITLAADNISLIGTVNVQAGAITNKYGAYTSAAKSITTSWKTIQSLTIDRNGNDIFVIFSLMMIGNMFNSIRLRFSTTNKLNLNDLMGGYIGGASIGYPMTYAIVVPNSTTDTGLSVSLQIKQGSSPVSDDNATAYEVSLATIELKR